MNTKGFFESAADSGDYFYYHCGKNACPPHFHNSTEILFCSGKSFCLTVDGSEIFLRQGDLAFIRGLSVHHYVDQGVPTEVLILGTDYFGRFQALAGNRTFDLHLPANPEFLKEIRPLFGENCLFGYWENELLRHGLADLFLGTLLKYYPLQPAERRPAAQVMTEILREIQEHFTESLTLEGLAQKYGYSKTYLSSLFNEFLGEHFRDYLNRQRIGMAEQLLIQKDQNKDTVLDISARCGFDSPNTFYRALKKFGKNLNF